jgi:hypothetical protein
VHGGIPGQAGEGSGAPAPEHGDERELVRAFTDLHPPGTAHAAARPVAPMRGGPRPATDVIDTRAVEAERIPTDQVAVPDDPVDTHDGPAILTRPGVLPQRAGLDGHHWANPAVRPRCY